MKFHLNESLFTEYKEPLTESIINEAIDDDGWDEELAEQPIISELEDFIYELKMAVKGANTGAKNYSELADYVRTLAEGLDGLADTIDAHFIYYDDNAEGEDEE